MQPFPHQIEGALFLADQKAKLLADQPRVGKTGSAIMAADMELAQRILVVTTASGRPVWRRAFGDWSVIPRKVAILANGAQKMPDVAIVSWAGITGNQMRAALRSVEWDRIILDESHYAKSIEAQRTQSALGNFLADGENLAQHLSLVEKAAGRVWYLTGTPIPNAPNDLYPMLRASHADCLRADAERGWPDVTKYNDFLHRYCVVKMKKISNFRRIPVVVAGRNLDELRARIGDFILLRTQQDVGIREPLYDLLPLTVSPAQRREAEKDIDAASILRAADAGDTKSLEMHLGPLRRITGTIKAHAVVAAVREEFECGLDKIVLAYWHKDVGDVLQAGLAAHGVLRIDGATPANQRGAIEQQFLHDDKAGVMLAQIEAAGEAVDFSSAALLWFVETAFSPKSMKQMALRITNHSQTRQVLVRVCVLDGSVDEALQAILLRKWTAIREVIGK